MKNLIMIIGLLTVSGIARPQWVQTGGPEGGDISCLAVMGNSVFAGAWGGGVHRSDDWGNSWKAVNNGIWTLNSFPRSFAVLDTVIVVAGTSGGINKSDDNGEHWISIGNSLTGGTDYVVAAEGVLYAASSNGIFASVSWDTNWIYRGNVGSEVRAFAYGAEALWAGTELGLFCSRNGGSSWDCVLPGHQINCMAFWSNTIFAGSCYAGVFASEDGGILWIPVNSGAPTTPNTMLVAGNTLYAGCWNGMYKSGLGSNINWSQITNGLDFYRVQALASSMNIIFAGTYGGIFVSANQGASWSPGNHGLIATNTFLRRKDQKIIAGTLTNGFFYTPDNGNSWTAISNGLERYDHVFLELSDLTFGGGIYYAATENGVYHSSDAGSSWINDTVGIGQTFVQTIAFLGDYVFAGAGSNKDRFQGVYKALATDLPDLHWYPYNEDLLSLDISVLYAAGDSDLFAGTIDYGIFWRRNLSPIPWVERNNGLGNLRIDAIADGGGYLFVGTKDGVYRSDDTGQNWEKLENPWTGAVDGIAVHGDTVFIMSESGIWFSKNSGSSWNVAMTNEFFGGPSILIGVNEVFVGTTGTGMWKRALKDIHTFHLTMDSVVLTGLENNYDSLFIECDTSWFFQGTMPDWLSANHTSGQGDGYVVFTTLQPNPGQNPRSNEFTLFSATGQNTGFTVIQLGNNPGVEEPGQGKIEVWPNPCLGQVTVSAPTPIKRIIVYTLDGREAEFTGFNRGTMEITINLPETGLKVIRIVTENGDYVRKVISMPGKSK